MSTGAYPLLQSWGAHLQQSYNHCASWHALARQQFIIFAQAARDDRHNAVPAERFPQHSQGVGHVVDSRPCCRCISSRAKHSQGLCLHLHAYTATAGEGWTMNKK